MHFIDYCMLKVCIIYNFAQHYRESIYKLMDHEWDCEWYFGNNKTDIKSISSDVLRNVTYVQSKKIIGPFWWQKQISHLIKRSDIDKFILLGDLFNLSTWWFLIKKKVFFKKKNVYLWSHGWYGKEGKLKKLLKRIYFGLADHVFTYGEYGKQIAIQQGFDSRKITFIHNSLNHSFQVKLREKLIPSNIYKIHFGNENPNLLFIGRLTEVKQLDLLIKAVNVLKQRGKNYNVVFIGSGQKQPELEKLTMTLGLQKQVWFYGACYDDKENAQLIFDADICVAPGNVGLTAMHTMVFGTPVLTHDDFKWQMPEFEAIKPNLTGDFFLRNDIISLADKIQEWVECHQDREQVRNNCFREIDSNWTPEFQLNVLKNVIEN